MQTITFTTNDYVGQLIHTIAEENNKPTADVIAESIRYYAEMLQLRKLQQQKEKAKHSRETTLDELLAGSPKEALALTDEDREWLNAPAVGKEIL